uniref:Xanthine dehydrogenase (inferred by orthology to a D. melanogaster protein) n=1 Tax=Anisakis simplex TaxID=6269 RepID=A0A0M3K673_ANISI
LTGTKIGCNEGGCGACTVMISDVDPLDGKIRHYSANACLTPVCAVFGKAVTTVEGIGNTSLLHPVQERLAKAHGSQCGFCTPGFIMAMYTLLRNNSHPTIAEIDEAIQGNLCRCTGYRPILEAFYSFSVTEDNIIKKSDQAESFCSLGEQCCRNKSKINVCGRNEIKKLSNFDDCKQYDPSQQIIFPPELKVERYEQRSFELHHNELHWYQPSSLTHALFLKKQLANSRIIAGNTEVGVEMKFRFIEIKHAINLKQTIAGNIVTASPISDLNPVWMSVNASVVLMSQERGSRTVFLDESFFIGYRKTIVKADEILVGIWIPYSNEVFVDLLDTFNIRHCSNQYVKAFKQAQRREDDISIVTSSMMVQFNENAPHTVDSMRIAYGGMAPTTKLAICTNKSLRGRRWDEELLNDGISELNAEFDLPVDVPGGMAKYRQALALSFFHKFYIYVKEQIQSNDNWIVGKDRCNIDHPEQKLISSQIFQDVPKTQSNIDPIGRPFMHQSGIKHTTGEAKYCDDYHPQDALSMVLVLSPIACGTLNSVDWSEALRQQGVRGYVDHHDVRDNAMLGHANDTPIFVKDKISYHCQPVGAIVADDHETARRAANLVIMNYTEQKPIVTIEEAVKNDSYLMTDPFVVKSCLTEDYGDHDAVTDDWSKYDHVVEGSVRIGGQEHFYFETQNCIVIPGEGDEMEVISSTQGVDDVQLTPERYDDMAISGTRHPFKCNYKVGVNKDGKLLNVNAELLSNCGHSNGSAFSINISSIDSYSERAIVHFDNVYRFPNAEIGGRMCRTNLASNTAFRGFGGPQGMFATETMMLQIAEQCGFDVNEIRGKNLYKEGECTPFGMHLRQCNIRRCWDECFELSDYRKRLTDIKHFNRAAEDGHSRSNKFIKRGIYVTPTKFGIGFGLKQLNQAGALVHIYRDGSVLISHGGMEMGQGLHTKMMQADISKVHICDTSTDKVPNASPTAASVGSDANGLAIMV